MTIFNYFLITLKKSKLYNQAINLKNSKFKEISYHGLLQVTLRDSGISTFLTWCNLPLNIKLKSRWHLRT